MEKELAQLKKERRKHLVIGSVCIFFVGILYAWSILKAPFAREFGWNSAELAVNFTFTFCSFCLGGLLTGVLLKKAGVRFTFCTSALLVLAGFTLVSHMSGRHIAVLYLGYGILCGLGIGMVYIAVVSTVNPWFPDKQGASSGVLMMCFGVSSLVLGNLAAVLMESRAGWRATFQGLGIVIFLVLVLGGLTLRPPAPDRKLPEAEAKKAQSREDFEPRDFSASEMLRRPAFYKFFFYSVLTVVVGNNVFAFAKDYALFLGAGPALAASLVGVASLCNGIGRLFSGYLFDTLGRKGTMLCANLLDILAPAIALTAVLVRSLALGILGLCCIGLGYGFSPTVTAAVTLRFFGKKYYSENYSIVNLLMIPVSLAATVSGALIERTGSYAAPFLMLLACAALALVLNLSLRRP
jgi:OFA family oxalate/formate antiporter-like MFS transporter